jgi:anti-anti-sigma factor
LIWRELAPLLKAPGAAVLSLAKVEHANSAALALLLEARELAQSHGCELRVQGVSAGLRDIARISGVEQLIEGSAR